MTRKRSNPGEDEEGFGGADLVEHLRNQARQHPGRKGSGGDTGEAEAQGLGENHAQNIRALRPDGLADADLGGALRHRISHHSVEADDGEQERQGGEARDEIHRLRGAGRAFCRRPPPACADRSREGRDRARRPAASAACSRPSRIAFGANGECEVRPGELRVGRVEDQARVGFEALRFDVARHAHDFGNNLAAGVGDVLSDRIFVRPEMMRHGLLTMMRRGASSSSIQEKSRPRRSGMPRVSK